MTRLQRMFIDLSQYRTVKELEKATSQVFINGLLQSLAFDKNGKVRPCKYFSSCKDCAIGCDKYDKSPFILTADYLNEEVSKIQIRPSRIVSIRNKALDALVDAFNSACAEHLNTLNTALYLDSICSLLEFIGLFEPDECHDKLIKAIKERTKK